MNSRIKKTVTASVAVAIMLCLANCNIKDGGTGIQMVLVKGDTFTMGATSEQDSDADSNEMPVHSVTLSSFYIGKYEVTQAEWKAVMNDNPSEHKGDSLPVEKISWDDVQEFIQKLNTKTGKNYRLPTEAEWEYAARGGKNSHGYKYSGSNNPNDVAWYDENSEYETHPVGTKKANELGIYDMSGNVFEWCQDRYGDYNSSSQNNPQGPSYGSFHINRGGSCDADTEHSRVSFRYYHSPGRNSSHLGFRLASDSK